MFKLNTILFLISGLLLSCNDDSSAPVAETPDTYFISSTKTADISSQTLKSLAVGFGQSQIASLLKYDVRTYNVVYATTYKGNPIEASGLLMVPVGVTNALPLVSLQHGTTFEKNEAPTVAGDFTGMELFASAGYVALVPDFIGYGKSEAIFHPYYDKDHSAFAVIDMIKAAKEFLDREKIAFNDKLFLAGYSEGGYVTLAAAKEIEQNNEHNLKVTAMAAGAGGYDLEQMLNGVATNSFYEYPSYLAFVLMSYNTTYDWNKPLTYFFKPQYADALNTYMNGQYSGGTINSKLTTNLNDLFNADFYARLKQADQELQLKEAIKRNSLSGWNTSIPTRLYHGTKDEIIPYQNSETTLQNFKNAGSKDVTLTLLPDGTHGSSFVPMMQDFIPWFLTL